MAVATMSVLTSERQAMWPEYRDKWDALRWRVGAVDRDRASEAVKMAYALAGYPDPGIINCASPKAAQSIIVDALKQSTGILRESRLGSPIARQIQSVLVDRLNDELIDRLAPGLREELKLEAYDDIDAAIVLWLTTPSLSLSETSLRTMGIALNSAIEEYPLPLRPLNELQLRAIFTGIKIWDAFGGSTVTDIPRENPPNPWSELEAAFDAQTTGARFRDAFTQGYPFMAQEWPLNALRPSMRLEQSSQIDFGISVSNCQFDARAWFVLKSFIQNCGWVFPFEKTVLVCDRPTEIDDRSTASFSDGFSLTFRRRAANQETSTSPTEGEA